MTEMTTPLLIITIVFNYFGVPLELQDSKTRVKEKVTACQFSMYFLRAYTNLSLAGAGAMFGKDHATTLHACRKINFEISKYNDTRQDAYILEKRIKDRLHELNVVILKAIQDMDENKYLQFDTDKC